MIYHYADTILELGQYSAHLHEKGGENLNNLMARAWSHGNLGNVPDRRAQARMLYQKSTMIIFSRVSRTHIPTHPSELARPYGPLRVRSSTGQDRAN